MLTKRPFFSEFLLSILLPSLAAAGGITVLLHFIVSGIFNESNRLDSVYAKRSANAALSLLRETIETLVHDNAVWDVAVKNTSGNVNIAWLQETWGNSSAQGNYDSVFVIDAKGDTLYAAKNGNPSQITAADYFGADLEPLLADLPTDGVSFGKASGIMETGGMLSVVAAGVIVPASEAAAAPGNTPHRLIFAKTIDQEVIANLSNRIALDDLAFTRESIEAEQAVAIPSPSGRTIATLTWADRSPGSIVRSKFGNVVIIIQSMFLFVIMILLYTSWKGFSEAHQRQAEALAASMRDDLTGLANRRNLLAVLTQRLVAARESGMELAVVYADLDGFKEVNDSYGHEIGDMLLKSAAAGFVHLAEGADLVARLGGDEFAIIVSGPNARDQSRQLAHNMITFFAEPMVFGGRIASVSVSIGIVDMNDDDADVKEMIRRADVAMYAAKAAGRNRFHVYERSLDFRRDEGRAIAKALREYIDSGSLSVVYQPIVDARSRTMRGVEALVRWPQNTRNHYTPDVFIPVAEEFGLIEDLGYFVLNEACRQAAQWQDIFVAVNVSPIQFMNPGFADMVEMILRKTGLEPNRLEVEVTEGFIIDNAERANTIINRLHDMRVGVALDDFGTGFSSIGHLRRFKFDKLKLDRSMVSDILRQPSALRLVQGTIAMADALGLIVVAEGIEDENQVSVLRLAGCGQFQGFLFSRPMTASAITDMQRQQRTTIAS